MIGSMGPQPSLPRMLRVRFEKDTLATLLEQVVLVWNGQQQQQQLAGGRHGVRQSAKQATWDEIILMTERKWLQAWGRMLPSHG